MPCARVCSSGAGGDRARRGRTARRCRSAGRASRRRRQPARNWSSNAARSSRMRSSPPSSAMFSRPISVMPVRRPAPRNTSRARSCSPSSASATPWSGRGRPWIGSPRMAMPPSTGWAAIRLGSLIVATYSASVSAGRRELGEAGEAVAGLRAGPAAVVHQPARHREVDERDDRVQAPLAAAVDHAAVVVEGGAGELALLRLDPAPLEAEPVGVQAGAGHQVQVLAPAVVGVAGVAAGLGERRVLGVLHLPVVVVDVAALDLVGGGGRAPEEAVGEAVAGHREISSSGWGRGRRRSGRRRADDGAQQGVRVGDGGAAPGDVLVGADEDQVGLVERAQPGQVREVERPAAGCPAGTRPR